MTAMLCSNQQHAAVQAAADVADDLPQLVALLAR